MKQKSKVIGTQWELFNSRLLVPRHYTPRITNWHFVPANEHMYSFNILVWGIVTPQPEGHFQAEAAAERWRVKAWKYPRGRKWTGSPGMRCNNDIIIHVRTQIQCQSKNFLPTFQKVGQSIIFPPTVWRLSLQDYEHLSWFSYYKGASIKYVRRFFGFFDPPPPPLYANSRNLAYWALVLRPHLGLYPPSPSARTYLMEAP